MLESLKKLRKKTLSISSDLEFEALALEIFQFQVKHCKIYRDFVHFLKIDINSINKVENIPFLPIELFKKHKIIAEKLLEKVIFSSSGTTGSVTSKHYLDDNNFYLENATQIFETTYGPIKNFAILALLPSYLERSGSSLIEMTKHFIDLSENIHSGFYLNNHNDLEQKIIELEKSNTKTLLIGVTFGLLDFIENRSIRLKNTIVMETGGMKGRRKELTRTEVHQLLKNAFETKSIHSEYGMTELLSQSYSQKDGIFKTPKTMRFLLRELSDPMNYSSSRNNGGLNIIDLANIHSCSFIATQDMAKRTKDGYEIIGRIDNSDIRGCNLMTI